MNAKRRKRVTELYVQLSDISDALQELKEEEQEAYDNLPYSFQNGERGQEIEEKIELLESAWDHVDEAVAALDEV